MAGRGRALYIGVAGWSIPSALAEAFPGDDPHLARYARVFSGVEINSTFRRTHRAGTYARWAASVPKDFRFAVKVPHEITHEKKLVEAGAALEAFVEQLAPLGAKLGPLLMQLPPSLGYDKGRAAAFFKAFRARFAGQIACEPRHPGWFTPAADALLARFGVVRVAADPAVVPEAAAPGGAQDFAYWRLHGSPRMYYSAYPEAALRDLTRTFLRRGAPPTQWCIFDNTARGAGTANALDLLARVPPSRR